MLGIPADISAKIHLVADAIKFASVVGAVGLLCVAYTVACLTAAINRKSKG